MISWLRPYNLAVVGALSFCACTTTANLSEKRVVILDLLTPQLIARHIADKDAQVRLAEVTQHNGITEMSFDVCSIKIARGGKLLSENDYLKARAQTERTARELKQRLDADRTVNEQTKTMALVAIRLLADLEGDFPKIGARARAGSFRGDWVVFTTSDRKLDIRISRPEVSPVVNVVGLAEEVSRLYDQRSEQRTLETR